MTPTTATEIVAIIALAITISSAMSFFVIKVVDIIKIPFYKVWPNAGSEWMVVISAIVGVVLAFGIQFNVYHPIFDNAAWLGYLFTGITIGGIASAVYNRTAPTASSVTVKSEPGGTIETEGLSVVAQVDENKVEEAVDEQKNTI